MKKKITTYEIALIPLFTALIAVCSFITIPVPNVPFTMQLFAIFLALACLGGRNGSIAVALYLVLGAIGLPIFSGFQGGIQKLLGPTGGYLSGFLFSALLYWLITSIQKNGRPKIRLKAVAMIAGLLVCYLFGTIWFYVVYTRGGNAITIGKTLMLCVIPFIPFDLLKITLALSFSVAIEKRGALKKLFAKKEEGKKAAPEQQDEGRA